MISKLLANNCLSLNMRIATALRDVEVIVSDFIIQHQSRIVNAIF